MQPCQCHYCADYKRNPDARNRDLWRSYITTGSAEDGAGFLIQKLRAQEIDPRRVELAAFLGDPASKMVFPDATLEYDEPYPHWKRGVSSNDVADVLAFGGLDINFVISVLYEFCKRVIPIWEYRAAVYTQRNEADPIKRSMDIIEDWLNDKPVDLEEVRTLVLRTQRTTVVSRGQSPRRQKTTYAAATVIGTLQVIQRAMGTLSFGPWDREALPLWRRVASSARDALRSVSIKEDDDRNTKDPQELQWQTDYLIKRLLTD